MTPRPGQAAGKPKEPEGEPDTVGVDTDTATRHDAAAGAEEVTEKPDTTELDARNTSDKSGAAESAEIPSEDSAGDQGTEDDAEDKGPAKGNRGISLSKVVAFGVLPVVAMLLAAAAGYLKWQDASMRAAQIGSVDSVAAAKDGTIAMLSYQSDSVEKDLGSARDRLTGTFKESYTQLTNDVVIPGAKQRHISAVATVPAAASVSATGSHAVALVFVNQTVVVGTDAPSATASAVRVKLDKVGDRWLISAFDPI
jgi:Mce-associated membrane protein